MGVPVFKMATVGILPSPLKRMYYRMKGARIGKKVKIGFLSVLTSKDIEIGDYSKIGMLTFIKARKIKIGKRVKIHMTVAIDTGRFEIDNDSVVMEQVIVGGMLTPRSSITIGKRVKIFPHSFLNPTEPITIGDDVGIGGSNYIFTHGTWQNVLEGFPFSFGPVTIEKGVWLPWRVFILPNVKIGEYAIIGADSTVTTNIPPRSIASGSPAAVKAENGRHIRNLTDSAKIKQVKKILSDFSEYLNYLNGSSTKVFDEPEKYYIDLGENKKLHLITSGHMETNTNDYFVFLNLIDDQQHQQLIAQNCKWFDLTGKRSTYHYKDKTWEEIKNYFSRYGIRFEYSN